VDVERENKSQLGEDACTAIASAHEDACTEIAAHSKCGSNQASLRVESSERISATAKEKGLDSQLTKNTCKIVGCGSGQTLKDEDGEEEEEEEEESEGVREERISRVRAQENTADRFTLVLLEEQANSNPLEC
jgi:hypothetical protein